MLWNNGWTLRNLRILSLNNWFSPMSYSCLGKEKQGHICKKKQKHSDTPWWPLPLLPLHISVLLPPFGSIKSIPALLLSLIISTHFIPISTNSWFSFLAQQSLLYISYSLFCPLLPSFTVYLSTLGTKIQFSGSGLSMLIQAFKQYSLCMCIVTSAPWHVLSMYCMTCIVRTISTFLKDGDPPKSKFWDVT